MKGVGEDGEDRGGGDLSGKIEGRIRLRLVGVSGKEESVSGELNGPACVKLN